MFKSSIRKMTWEGKEFCQVTLNLNSCYRSKKEGKDQESIQSSTIPMGK